MDLGYWQLTWVLLVPGILWASWIDYKERRVPNKLNLAIALVGFAAQAVYNGAPGLVSGALGLLVGFGLLIVPWLMHGMGAGDVKLMAAIGVWLGPALTLYSFTAGAVIGGVIAMIMILSSGRLRMAYVNLSTIVTKCASRKTVFSEYGSAKSFGATSQLLPYGVPLTIGTILIMTATTFGWWGL